MQSLFLLQYWWESRILQVMYCTARSESNHGGNKQRGEDGNGELHFEEVEVLLLG